ncbi:hypothetical protein XaC1_81 [Xanthomonas phage XaC1]|nr:hypothetical protein XaC1_81 [Xanthomonas phage XaC1]
MNINYDEFNLIAEKLNKLIQLVPVKKGNSFIDSESTNKRYLVTRAGAVSLLPIVIQDWYKPHGNKIITFVKSKELTRMNSAYVNYSTALFNTQIKLPGNNGSTYEVIKKADLCNKDDFFNMTLIYDWHIVQQLYVLQILKEKYNIKTVFLYKDTFDYLDDLLTLDY